MKNVLAIAVGFLVLALACAAPALAEPCLGGGVPGLNRVAQRLKVRSVEPSRSALNACDGRAYEIGGLLSAALDRIERLEKSQVKIAKGGDR